MDKFTHRDIVVIISICFTVNLVSNYVTQYAGAGDARGASTLKIMIGLLNVLIAVKQQLGSAAATLSPQYD